MIYLVNCKIVESHYEGVDNIYERNHIVEAESEGEAKDKVVHHYDTKNVPYYIAYSVNIDYSTELIK